MKFFKVTTKKGPGLIAINWITKVMPHPVEADVTIITTGDGSMHEHRKEPTKTVVDALLDIVGDNK